MTTSQRVFIALLLAAAVQIIIYYPRLPEDVASHFGHDGHPNGWSTKPGFFIVEGLTVVLMALVFLFLPKTLSRFSETVISLPNKDYWLAPERRERTFLLLQDQMCWFGSATMAFLIGVFQIVIDANLNPPPVLPSSFMFLLIAYLAFTGWWVIRFVGRFARVPK